MSAFFLLCSSTASEDQGQHVEIVFRYEDKLGHLVVTSLKPMIGEVKIVNHVITIQHSAGHPWLLAFMCMLPDIYHTLKHCYC